MIQRRFHGGLHMLSEVRSAYSVRDLEGGIFWRTKEEAERFWRQQAPAERARSEVRRVVIFFEADAGVVGTCNVMREATNFELRRECGHFS